MKNPCKDCTERVLGCHGTCEKYRGYRKELEDQKEKIRIEKLLKSPTKDIWADRRKK